MKNYIKDYCGDFQFNFIEHISKVISNISINIDVYEAQKTIDGIINHKEKALISLTKGNLKYNCELFDEHNYESCFFKIELSGRSYLLFRKTLYGFTLIDSEALLEFYDYTPKAIETNEESFIITDVKQIGDFLVFEGCYWGCPYECFAFDFNKKLFVNVSNYLGVSSLDKTEIKDNKLILTGTSNNVSIAKEINQDEIATIIDKQGQAEI